MHKDLSYTQNRELSWLKFNERVLAQADDPTVPLMERLRFVSIFASNLDEFFMVRVGSLVDLTVIAPNDAENKSGMTPAEQLTAVYHAVRPLVEKCLKIFSALTTDLKEAGIEELSYADLNESQKSFVQAYYKNQIRPILSPQIIDRCHPFPHLKNKELYVAALLSNHGKEHLALVDIPTAIPPIVLLPGTQTKYIRTENIVAAHMKKLFKIYSITEQSVISVTRNADISMDEEKFDEDNPDFLNYMSRLLRKRERLAPVRLEMENKASGLQKVLCESLRLEPHQVYVTHYPLLLKYAYMLDKCRADAYYTPYTPVYPAYLNREQPIAEQIRQRDVMLFYPYQSIQPFIDLIKQAAVDPQVVSIKITIYRLAHYSAIAKALCEAAENGKEVIALMELRARFDEQNNIDWAREMEESGCHILYGPENFKCHAKVCLITRRERSGFSYITQIGTGNYNEKTSTLYTDFCMMTANPDIAQDAVSFFQNMLIANLDGEYGKLLVAPNAMKTRVIDMINAEIAKGEYGRIIIKANSVTERDIIDKLSEASCAGVKVDLIIRGICCLLPSVPGKTENIRVTSIVGRFLEHSRIYCFGSDENVQMYLASADMMTRNQVRRVEVAGPVLSAELKAFLYDYLMRTLDDNTKAWRLNADGTYTRLKPAEGEPPRDVQAYYLSNPPQFAQSKQGKPTMSQRLRKIFGK